MAHLVHRFDQRQPVVSFRDEKSDIEVEVLQHGADSKRFAGDTSSVLWPIANYLGRYLCERYGRGGVAGESAPCDTATASDDAEPLQSPSGSSASTAASGESPSPAQVGAQAPGCALSCAEVGAGTGLVGLVCAQLPAFGRGGRVVLTDQTTEFVAASAGLEKNKKMAAANGCAVHVAPLSWGDAGEMGNVVRAHGRFDVVLVSDCICHQDDATMRALVATVDALLKPKQLAGGPSASADDMPEPVALVAYEYRDDWFTCETFMAHVEAFGFDVRTHNLDPTDDDSDYLLYELRRK